MKKPDVHAGLQKKPHINLLDVIRIYIEKIYIENNPSVFCKFSQRKFNILLLFTIVNFHLINLLLLLLLSLPGRE